MFGGGESQRSKALLCWGYSRKAQCMGNQASVKPITRGETGHSQSSRFYKNPKRGGHYWSFSKPLTCRKLGERGLKKPKQPTTTKTDYVKGGYRLHTALENTNSSANNQQFTPQPWFYASIGFYVPLKFLRYTNNILHNTGLIAKYGKKSANTHHKHRLR